ncbi:MAG: acyl-CoA dehydrogenase family protein [Candidatus Syntropharchaeales archaeon]
MNFELTEEQKDIRKAAREFAEGEIADVAKEYDRDEIYPRDIIKKAAQLGFIGIYIPEEYGGAGLGFLDDVIVAEEFSRVDPGIALSLFSTTFGCTTLLAVGSEEQKQKYIPPLCSGEKIAGIAITDPDAGSDVAGAVSTKAVLDGNEWIINGSKTFITNGSVADYLLVMCVTDPDATSIHRRHSTFIVETDRPGFEAERCEGKMGIRASDTADLTFSDLRVPKENLIGERGEGFKNIMYFFDRSRLEIAAQGLGLAQGAFEKTIDHIKKREIFGKPVAAFQVNQFKVAEMATKIEAARTLLYRAALSIDENRIDSKLVAMAKWNAARVGVEVVDEAVQMHGGYGYINEYDVERFYRAAKVIEIYEGTKEVEKVIISRAILGDVCR